MFLAIHTCTDIQHIINRDFLPVTEEDHPFILVHLLHQAGGVNIGASGFSAVRLEVGNHDLKILAKMLRDQLNFFIDRKLQL